MDGAIQKDHKTQEIRDEVLSLLPLRSCSLVHDHRENYQSGIPGFVRPSSLTAPSSPLQAAEREIIWEQIIF